MKFLLIGLAILSALIIVWAIAALRALPDA